MMPLVPSTVARHFCSPTDYRCSPPQAILTKPPARTQRWLDTTHANDVGLLPHPGVADRTWVAQVLGNLLQNAAKFTAESGRTQVSVSAEAQRAVVRVAHNGVGIASETLQRLFQPFTQAEQTLDRSKGGGLGLALVKGLVEWHGGPVSAHSEGREQGTEVIVLLTLD